MNKSESDWRLNSQEDYLQGKKLRLTKFVMKDPRWDHEHCEFCWGKFMENTPGTMQSGYVDEDNNWICQTCFEDFRERFEWQLEKE
jgi:hypothetical protein